MKTQLHRFSNEQVAVTKGNIRVQVLGAEEVETLDASSLSREEQSQIVARPDKFEIKTGKGKATSIVRKTPPNNEHKDDDIIRERNP